MKLCLSRAFLILASLVANPYSYGTTCVSVEPADEASFTLKYDAAAGSYAFQVPVNVVFQPANPEKFSEEQLQIFAMPDTLIRIEFGVARRLEDVDGWEELMVAMEYKEENGMARGNFVFNLSNVDDAYIVAYYGDGSCRSRLSVDLLKEEN